MKCFVNQTIYFFTFVICLIEIYTKITSTYLCCWVSEKWKRKHCTCNINKLLGIPKQYGVISEIATSFVFYNICKVVNTSANVDQCYCA